MQFKRRIQVALCLCFWPWHGIKVFASHLKWQSRVAGLTSPEPLSQFYLDTFLECLFITL
jgi:hypothetical protein